MCLRLFIAASLLFIVVGARPADAEVKYWDLDTLAGAGGAAPSGTWSATGATWNTNLTGSGDLTTWTSGGTAVFAAGSDATGEYTVNVSGTQTLAGLTVEEGAVTQAVGRLDFGATPDAQIHIAAGSTYIKNVQGTFSGTGGLVKTGTGTLDFDSKTNDFSKAGAGNQAFLTIAEGVVAFTDERELGAIPTADNATALTINGGTLRLEDAQAGTTTALANRRGVFIGDSGGTFDVAGPFTLALPSTAPSAAALSGSGTIIKIGIGRLSLNRPQSTFTGKYIIKEGTLGFANDGVLGPVPSAPLPDYITLDGGGLIPSVNTGPVLNANRGITLGPNGGFLGGRIEGFSYSGVIAGSQGGGLRITLNDAVSNDTIGSIRLSGANTYDGATQIDPLATLSITILADGGVPSGLGTSSSAASNLVLNGGTLRIGNAAGASTNRSFTLTPAGGSINNSGAGTVSFNSTDDVAMSGAGPRTLTFRGFNNTNNTFALALGDAGTDPTTLTKADTGTWVINNTANSYTGDTAISNGRLRLGASEVIPNASRLTTSGAAMLDLNGFDETVKSLSGTGGTVQLGARALTVNNPNGDTYGGVITGDSGRFVKAGSGTLTLTGQNTYSGDTTVLAGTLSLTRDYLSNFADVHLSTGSILNLNYVGIDAIHSLFIDGVVQSPGTWGAMGSGTDHQTPLITGLGRLMVSTAMAIPGDFNHDGHVDAADYVLWRKNDGTPTGFNAWRANFGSGPVGSSSIANVAVPEVGPSALFGILLISLQFRRPSPRTQLRGREPSE